MKVLVIALQMMLNGVSRREEENNKKAGKRGEWTWRQRKEGHEKFKVVTESIICGCLMKVLWPTSHSIKRDVKYQHRTTLWIVFQVGVDEERKSKKFNDKSFHHACSLALPCRSCVASYEGCSRFYDQIMPLIMYAISIVSEEAQEELFIVLCDNYFSWSERLRGVARGKLDGNNDLCGAPFEITFQLRECFAESLKAFYDIFPRTYTYLNANKTSTSIMLHSFFLFISSRLIFLQSHQCHKFCIQSLEASRSVSSFCLCEERKHTAQ